MSEGGVKTTAELISIKGSSFSKSILDYSNKYEADLIIIMTQEENDFSYNVLGSEAKYIINNSEIPVMSIRPLVKIAQVYSLP